MSAWVTALKQLMPRGVLWNFGPDSNITRTLTAIADSADRIDGRATDLIEESDPRTATETLSDWESMLGLPDEVILEIPDTVEERRLAITQHLTRRGGQNAAFYITLAETCGYTVTIVDDYAATVAYCGRALCGDPLNDEAWAYVWTVVVSAIAGTALSMTEFEAVIARVAPAHTTVLFDYP